VGDNAKRPARDQNLADWRRFEPEVRTLLKNTSPAVIGARLKRYRLRQGLSIRDLAAKAGVSTNSVLRIESGGDVHALTLIKICASLGLHVVRLGDVDHLDPEGISAVHRHEDDRWYDLTDFGSGPVGGRDRPLSQEERAEMVGTGTVDVPLMIMKCRLESGRLMQSVIELYHPSEARSHSGEEFIYVLEGTATITVGTRQYVLDKGEGITFWSTEEHTYAPAEGSELPVRLLSVFIDEKPRPGA
jgi:DNA-binding XRE family transcriptional regulator/quercetin dioxygenase-like cupin family protein